MAKPDTWMPFYVGDYLKDTMHLSTLEHGAYMLLIMAYWVKGKALDDDAVSFAAICRVSVEEWQRALNTRLSTFFEVRDGKWFHVRVEEELEKANRICEQKIRAGKASANARYNARSTPVGTSVPTATPTEVQRSDCGCEGDSTEEEFPTNLQTPEFFAAWSAWQQHRKEIRKPLTPTQTAAQLAELSDIGPAKAVARIRNTIAKGWQGMRDPDPVNGKSKPVQDTESATRAISAARKAQLAADARAAAANPSPAEKRMQEAQS